VSEKTWNRIKMTLVVLTALVCLYGLLALQLWASREHDRALIEQVKQEMREETSNE
jgi:hypothetical protein